MKTSPSARRPPARTASAPDTRRTVVVHPHWSASWVFVLAASGAAIGFNNLWQFPYLVHEHGGGAFVFVYLFCVLVVALPLLMAEIGLGKAGRASPIGSFRLLADRARADPNWVIVGWMATIAGFLIFSYLSVIAGWTMAYALRSALGVFVGQTSDGITSLFSSLVRDPEKQLFWHTAFVATAMFIAGRGVRAGLEPMVRVAMPLLFVLLTVLLVYAATTEAFGRALYLLFMPDFNKLTAAALLSALGHAFFSLGLGMGAMLMFSAYAGAEIPVGRSALIVAGIDTGTGLAAAVIVYSVLFAGSVDQAAGPGLVFHALPLAFDHLPFGRFLGTVFFCVLVIAALLTAVALVEPTIAWLVERVGHTRWRAAMICGVSAWSIGVVMVLSFNHWAFSFRFFGAMKKLGLFDVAQIVTAQVLLPLVGILTALFAGWAMRPGTAREVLALRSPCAFDAWQWSVRISVPLILVVLMFNLPKLLA